MIWLVLGVLLLLPVCRVLDADRTDGDAPATCLWFIIFTGLPLWLYLRANS